LVLSFIGPLTQATSAIAKARVVETGSDYANDPLANSIVRDLFNLEKLVV
jgi:hypothetical protein